MGTDDVRERAFRRLFEDHAGPVARYAARRSDAGEVHDVVSETFLVAWKRLGDVPEDALPWLFATARRVMANRRRSATRRRALGEKLAAEVVAAPGGMPGAPDIDLRILAAIRDLPDAEREAFMLVAWDGLEPSRAAQAAGCGAGALRMRLHRARAQLRRTLSEDMTLEDSR